MKTFYTKYWVRSGIEVIDKKQIGIVEKPLVMIVDRLLKKSIEMEGEGRRVLTVGVMTHWWDYPDDGPKYRTGRFNVSELCPKEIYDKGISELAKWEEFQNKQR